MKYRIALAGAALAVSSPQELSFHAEADTRLRREFRETTRWSLVDMIERVGGTDRREDLPEVEGELVRVLTVRDELAAVGDGRPLRVAREITAAELDARVAIDVGGVGAEDYELALESPMADAELAVSWDPDDEAYAAKLEAGGDRDVAERMRHDLDLLALLPGGGAAAGDTWTVEGEALAGLLAPGGDLGMELVAPPAGAFELMEPVEVLCAVLCNVGECAADVEGELRVEWLETVEENGEQLAILDLELEATFSRALGPRVESLAAGSGSLPAGFEFTCDWSVEGSGRCLWSLTAGTARALRLELDTSIRARIGYEAYGTDVEREFGLEGTTGLDFAFERE